MQNVAYLITLLLLKICKTRSPCEYNNDMSLNFKVTNIGVQWFNDSAPNKTHDFFCNTVLINVINPAAISIDDYTIPKDRSVRYENLSSDLVIFYTTSKFL